MSTLADSFLGVDISGVWVVDWRGVGLKQEESSLSVLLVELEEITEAIKSKEVRRSHSFLSEKDLRKRHNSSMVYFQEVTHSEEHKCIELNQFSCSELKLFSFQLEELQQLFFNSF